MITLKLRLSHSNKQFNYRELNMSLQGHVVIQVTALKTMEAFYRIYVTKFPPILLSKV